MKVAVPKEIVPNERRVALVPQTVAKGAVLIAFLRPPTNLDLVRLLAEKGITSFSMDAIPRIARAQSMDALSSMSTLAGYQAVLMAAVSMGKLFPMMITAAGTFAPAKGLVIGAGVGGVQGHAPRHPFGGGK